MKYKRATPKFPEVRKQRLPEVAVRSLEHLTMIKTRLELHAKDRLLLPPYKGSALRGGFGHALRRVGCFCPSSTPEHFDATDSCPYHYLFETPGGKGAGVLRGLSTAPQPFVLEPPLETRTEYAPGDPLRIEFLLVGKAIEYLPYFLAAFEFLGIQGIGKGKGRYQITKISTVDSAGMATPLNLARFGSMEYENDSISLQAVQKAHPKPSVLHELTLNFVTPTRLKYGNHLCDAPEFHVLFRNLARRISLLAYFHCGGRWEDSLADEVKMAESVTMVRNGLEWRDWRRYSNRQEEEMYLGGFVGRLGFRGNLEPFWPYLVLGSYLHIGKGATFGLGQYTLDF